MTYQTKDGKLVVRPVVRENGYCVVAAQLLHTGESLVGSFVQDTASQLSPV